MRKTEERLSELKDRMIEITQNEQQRENRLRGGVRQSLKNLQDSNRSSNIHAIEVSKGEEKNGRADKSTKRNNGRKFPKFGRRPIYISKRLSENQTV